MNIGHWIPKSDENTPTKAGLEPLLLLPLETVEALTSQAINQPPLSNYRPWLKGHREKWQILSNQLTIEEIIHLIHCFTLLEQHEGWDAGRESPVIWLFKAYKDRTGQINNDLVSWIKTHTNNKFLPFGSL